MEVPSAATASGRWAWPSPPSVAQWDLGLRGSACQPGKTPAKIPSCTVLPGSFYFSYISDTKASQRGMIAVGAAWTAAEDEAGIDELREARPRLFVGLLGSFEARADWKHRRSATGAALRPRFIQELRRRRRFVVRCKARLCEGLQRTLRGIRRCVVAMLRKLIGVLLELCPFLEPCSRERVLRGSVTLETHKLTEQRVVARLMPATAEVALAVAPRRAVLAVACVASVCTWRGRRSPKKIELGVCHSSCVCLCIDMCIDMCVDVHVDMCSESAAAPLEGSRREGQTEYRRVCTRALESFKAC